MKSAITHSILALTLSLVMPSLVSADNEKILVFRDSIPYNGHLPAITAGIAMLKEFGAANKFSIDTTVKLSSFNSVNLANYDAVAFLHPYREVGTGVWLNDTMNASQDSAFQSFMLSGKGLIGIHCADRLNNNRPWYLNLLGVQYLNDLGPQNCTYHVADINQPMTKGIPLAFVRSQQVRCNTLFFSDTSGDFTVLIKADGNDYPNGQKQTFYPYVWMHDYKGARVWCGSMGHTPETFASDTIWRKLMLRGILYALNRPGYGNATTACKGPVPGRVTVPHNAEGLTANQDRNQDGFATVYDCAGRTVGRMDRRQLVQKFHRPSRGIRSSGIYFVDVPGNPYSRSGLKMLFGQGTE